MRASAASLSIVSCLALVAACGGDRPAAKAPPSAGAEASASGTTASRDALDVVGTLVVAPGNVKSVDAYLGRFEIVDGANEVHVFASDRVSEETLETFAGKRVRVRGPRVPKRAPEPGEQAPLGPDGKPMMRPGGVRATSIEAVP